MTIISFPYVGFVGSDGRDNEEIVWNGHYVQICSEIGIFMLKFKILTEFLIIIVNPIKFLTTLCWLFETLERDEYLWLVEDLWFYDLFFQSFECIPYQHYARFIGKDILWRASIGLLLFYDRKYGLHWTVMNWLTLVYIFATLHNQAIGLGWVIKIKSLHFLQISSSKIMIHRIWAMSCSYIHYNIYW